MVSCPIYFRSYFVSCAEFSGNCGIRSSSFTSSDSNANTCSVDCGCSITLFTILPSGVRMTSVTIRNCPDSFPWRSNSSMRMVLRAPYVGRTATYSSSFAANFLMISSGGSEGGSAGSGVFPMRFTSCSGGGAMGAEDSCATTPCALQQQNAQDTRRTDIGNIHAPCHGIHVSDHIDLDARGTPEAARTLARP